MSALITPQLVLLDRPLGATNDEAITTLAATIADTGRTTQPDQLVRDALAREATSATGLPGGIAIPHCRTAAVEEPTLAFARVNPPIDFGAKDGPADLVFLICAPADGDADHLQILAKLARALARADFKASLRAAATSAEVADLINSAVALPTASATPAPTPAARSLVAVTACPTGIAHTYMAAEALEAAAARAGVTIHVETQGSAGSKPLGHDTIAAASAVIFACDVGVRDRSRFAGLPVINSGVKRAIDAPDAMIAEAIAAAGNPNAARVEGLAAAAADPSTQGWGAHVRRVLMTGVSYMIPFVAAGGLLIALGFLLGGYDSAFKAGDILVNHSLTNLPSPSLYGLHHVLFNSPTMLYIGVLLFYIGKTAFILFPAVLAGYIAFAIADRPGIAPGFVMGALATNVAGFMAADGKTGPAVTGFIGAIIGGVLAGLMALWITRWRVPVWARGLMPVVVIPLVTCVVVGLLMLLVLGHPVASLMTSLNNGLNDLNGGSAVILGIILGLMMAFDMGGPLNKVAYGFATAGIGTAATASGDAPQLKIMAAVMLAGMVPPIGLALATALRPRLFTVAERENGKSAWLLGASFITEGAIPFAAADPLRVIPSIMLGSAVTGGLAEAFHVTSRAPHGGIFVLFAIGNVGGFLVSLAAGVIVAAGAVIALKASSRTDPEALAAVA